MNKSVYLALILFLGSLSYCLEAKNIRAYMNYTIFKSPTDGPYIETYLAVSGESVVFKQNEKGLYQSVIEVTLVFKQNEKIVDFDKYELFSPEITDTNNIDFNFLDMQRYFIPEGTYDFDITVADKNAGKKPFNAVQPVTIGFEKEKICFSGIQLIESFTKSAGQSIVTKGGYDIIPMVHNFYSESLSKIIFYTEIYNSDMMLGAGQKFLIACMLKSFETGNTLSDYTVYKRIDTKEVCPFLFEYDISSLPSGNYTLLIEARDKENKTLATGELFFQRSNPKIQYRIEDLAAVDITHTFADQITNEDTLTEFISSLHPICTELERYFIDRQMKTADLKTKQQFFYNFWQGRDFYNPQQAWIKYNDMVHVVNAVYSTQIQKGYDTDRGRVYLKYGPPNIITESYNEPSSYPYEIWQYYELGQGQRNRKFVFYTYELITKDFKLLHSDAIGEISNYKWKIFLNNRWYDPYNVDATEPPPIWGGKADDYFRNPR
jgi:GWxTD domain-containing protein